MRARGMWLAAALTFVPAAAWGQAKQEAPLPLKRVRLYETGVGYFERNGVTRGAGAGEVALPVPAGHLDDALKTLVVLGKDGSVAVDGVEFASSVSRHMGLALAGLPPDEQGKISYTHLLDSLKGAAVEITAASGRFQGRLVDVEPPPDGGHRECSETPGPGGVSEELCVRTFYQTLLLLTTGTEIRRFKSTEVSSVKPTDPAFTARLGAALDAGSRNGTQGARKLRVLGKPGQDITLGYIAETPVWRSTYRLVLSTTDGEQDVLQGWALLHNDTDEDWSKVNIELVNGRPDSFLFPLAAPRYARRDLITPERELHTVPQLLDQTVDNMWAPADSFGAGGLGLSGIGEGGGGRGYGVGLGQIGTLGNTAVESGLLAVGNLAGLAKAEGAESGALFQYALERPIDLRAHGSALLPFASEKLDVIRIAVVPVPGETARTGAHFKNSTRQTLPAGTIAVFASGGFAGETSLSRTKPGESRILEYGFDLDIELVQAGLISIDEPRVLLFEKGTLTEHYIRKQTVTYALSNKSGTARRVYLPLDYVSNADVQGADSLTYDDERGRPIAVFESQSGANDRRVLEVREGLSRSHASKDAVSFMEKLRELAKATSIAPAQRAILAKAIKERDGANKLGVSIARQKRDVAELTNDLARLRDNLKALRPDSDGHDQLAEKLLRVEAKIDALRQKIRQQQRDQTARARASTVALEQLGDAAKKAAT